ncbi:hypothetical protein V0288_24935 [Pannus brasiliensis CCIBt3594]|uniref:Uncharacterized protein n=1 Tax=Pannus brasiliensis CCIBt3594 TaxID=1427578 RepID=A0AAW9QZN2_9CHRO
MRTLIAAAVGAIGLSLIATEAKSQTVFKTVENGRDVIYARGVTPNTSLQLTTTGGSRPTALLANSCGIIRVTANQATPNSVNINGTARSIANAVSLTGAPVCNGSTAPWTGGTSSEPRRDPNGNYYFSGYTPSQAATVLVAANGNRNATANQCGIARFAEPAEGNPWGNDFSFAINGTNYTLGTMTSQTYPPLCRNVGSSTSPVYLRYEAAP